MKLCEIAFFPKGAVNKKQRKPVKNVTSFCLFFFACAKSQLLIPKDYEVTMDHQVEGSGHMALEDGVNCGYLKPPCTPSARR